MDLLAHGLHAALRGPAPEGEEVPPASYEACRKIMVACEMVIQYLSAPAPVRGDQLPPDDPPPFG
jgi:hypothetical protein